MSAGASKLGAGIVLASTGSVGVGSTVAAFDGSWVLLNVTEFC